jgi:hypothetical protein
MFLLLTGARPFSPIFKHPRGIIIINEVLRRPAISSEDVMSVNI